MNLSYIGGFFDGEGQVALKILKKKLFYYNMACKIYNSERFILEKIQHFFGFGSIYLQKENLILHKGKTYCWEITKKSDVKYFLRAIYPYIYLKRVIVAYVLNNYSFVKGNLNKDFDFMKFRNMIKRRNRAFVYHGPVKIG